MDNQIRGAGGQGPLLAHTFNEVRYYLMVTPCAQCLQGPWETDSVETPPRPDQPAALRAHCKHCSARRTFDLVCEFPVAQDGAGAECINPTEAPSHIIDLGQWLSLFYLLVESAATGSSKVDTRRAGYRAALCLAEALKFYTDEMPPESAFFWPRTAEAFHEHPENFARQRLRDMQAKLPDISSMGRRVDLDERSRVRRWWRFWQ